jgi:serine/threonine-protein kinase
MTEYLLNNRYQILQTLGRGGFGETFLAIDTYLPSARKCVIKLLKPAIQQHQMSEWLEERFQREAVILEELGEHHSQIPRLYAYFSENDNFYLVQEWIEGVTLTEKQQQQGNLSEGEIRDILINILPVLDYIHRRRIIHRDIKPDNIILGAKDGKPVLIDFGIIKETMATVFQPNGTTALSVALGTPGYMPSEQAAGRPVYSSDLYSLGLTAVFLLTGKTPQNLETDSRSGEILWRKEVPRLHSSLATVLDRAIRFHPRDRFASAQEMLKALQTSTNMPTAATVAVSAGNVHQTKPIRKKQQTAIPTAPLTSVREEEEAAENSWMKWMLPLFFFGAISLGAFVLGFNFFFSQQQLRPTPSPSESFDSNPQTFPTPEFSPPAATPTPNWKPKPTPPPEESPTPTPEESPTPTPEVSPTPTPEVSPTPTPEVSPTAKPPEASPSPSLEASPKPPPPSPKNTPKPPEASLVPTPKPSAAIPIPVPSPASEP